MYGSWTQLIPSTWFTSPKSTQSTMGWVTLPKGTSFGFSFSLLSQSSSQPSLHACPANRERHCYDVTMAAHSQMDIPAVCQSRRRKAALLLTSSVPYSVKVLLELAEQPTQFRKWSWEGKARAAGLLKLGCEQRLEDRAQSEQDPLSLTADYCNCDLTSPI